MRVVLPCLAMMASVLPSTQPASGASTEQQLPTLPAVSSDSLVDAYGVGIHLPFLDTPYKDAGKVAAALADLGVRHVRDDLRVNDPREYAGIRTVAAQGIRFNLIMGNPSSADSAATYVDTVATQLPAGSVESLEGSNEWDISGDPQWATNLLTRQRELYRAAKANPATSTLPVLSPALAFRWNYAAAGDLSPYADVANGHMYPGGFKPSTEVGRITAALRGSVPAPKPLVTTEAGYHNATSTTNGHRPVPEDVAGVYLPRLLLEHYLQGDRRIYSYELIDEFADPALTNPEAHFGLLRRDFTPKPAYTAMKTLLGLLSDPGPTFTPQALPIKVTGFPSDGRYVVTQKRDGQYVVLLWRDVQIYDPELKRATPVTATTVTVQLARTSDLKVYRPSQQSTPVSASQSSTLSLPVDGAVTALTIGRPPVAAPTPVPAPAGNATVTPVTPKAPAVRPAAPTIKRITGGRGRVTLTWRAPAPSGRSITGYQLVSGARSVTVTATKRKATLVGLPKRATVRVCLRARAPGAWSACRYSRPVRTKR